MKRLLFIFVIIFIFIFSFSSSAETLSNIVDFSSYNQSQIDNLSTYATDSYSVVAEDGIKITSKISIHPYTDVYKLDLSDLINNNTTDIILNDIEVSGSGSAKFGIIYNNRIYYKDNVTAIVNNFKNGVPFSIIGHYVYSSKYFLNGEISDEVDISLENLSEISALCFYLNGESTVLTFSSISFIGEKITTLPSGSASGQTGNIISPDDMGLNIWNGITNNSGNLIIILSVALSIVCVFIAIKIALNLFHEGVK